MGKPWHDAGKMMSKKNTFTDFIAVAEQLIADKYTSKDRLAIEGGIGRRAAHGRGHEHAAGPLQDRRDSRVPFVDVINTMLDESLPLTVGEFEEWGNPKKKEEYDYIKSYSPYDNLAAKAYPTMLVKTSFDDSQVMYWEPAKYVAKLQDIEDRQEPARLQDQHGGRPRRRLRAATTA